MSSSVRSGYPGSNDTQERLIRDGRVSNQFIGQESIHGCCLTIAEKSRCFCTKEKTLERYPIRTRFPSQGHRYAGCARCLAASRTTGTKNRHPQWNTAYRDREWRVGCGDHHARHDYTRQPCNIKLAMIAVPSAPTFTQRGFTLVELAIVLFIVALLLGGMLLPLSAQQDIRARQETEKVLGEARDALLGYVVVNTRLPCPDTDADGAENGSAGACADQEGDFPYQTLGTAQSDGWGYRLRYRVASSFSGTIALTSAGDITVFTRGDDPVSVGTTESKKENLLATAPAVILSVGKNGYGGMPQAGGTRSLSPASGTDEYLNFIGVKKISRLPASGASGCADDENEGTQLCAFDDQLVWLSANTIFNRLVAASKL